MKRWLFLFFIFFSFNRIFCASKSIAINKFNFQNISQTIPIKLAKIILSLQKPVDQRSMPNRAILHGEPGNGKTTVVYEIEKLVGAKVIEIKQQKLVKEFQGTAPNDLSKMLRFCEEESKKRFIIVLIDEVEGLAKISDEHSNNNFDRFSAKQELWTWMDNIKTNKNIFLFMNTNMYKSLDSRIVDRCGDNIIEIQNPDLQMRKEIIKFHFQKLKVNFYGNSKLESEYINYIANNTNTLSGRAIADIINSACEDAREFNKCILDKILFDEIIKVHKNKPREMHKDKKDDEDKYWLSRWIQNGAAGVNIVRTFIDIIRLTKNSELQSNGLKQSNQTCKCMQNIPVGSTVQVSQAPPAA